MTNWVFANGGKIFPSPRFGLDRSGSWDAFNRPNQNPAARAQNSTRGSSGWDTFDSDQGSGWNSYRPPEAVNMNEPQPIPVTVVDVTPGNTLASVVGLPPARVEQPLPQRQRASLPTNPANLDDYLNALAGMGIVGGGLAFGLSTGLAQRSQSNQNQLPLTGGTMGMM